ncbi:MAG: hypothetical protein KatS3mg014_0680 [Actinomycetota bacterium]|nr:MAG: hypothetical protein KatS3mg014_0680 [Actinomycetota bacterium]
MRPIDRRTFLKAAGGSAVGVAALGRAGLALRRLAPVTIPNPLERYPERDWEHVYRDQYRYDSSFPYVCSPNDTHACRMRAFVRNGVVTRIEQNYDAGRISDALGNSTTAHWNPRGCPKGMTMQRRIYGPYRLRYPMLRKGWKAWADDGYPYLTPELRERYGFTSRGTDTFVRVSWDEAFRYVAGALVATAEHYSGDEGARRLLDEGYEPEMVQAMAGAGTRTIKMRGGMGLLGVLGKYGMYRFNNMLALLDAKVRGVPPEQALGGRNWSNYTWHGDQAPGFPFVHGLQNADVDFNDLRNSRLHIQVGKNLVENKMADSHFFHEIMERGGKIVAIAPEYSPPASKSDYWIPVRPQTDAALFLGIARLMIDRGWYDPDFVKRFTDLPILVRTDTLKRLDPADVFPGYEKGLRPDGPSFAEQGLAPEDYERLQDFVVWDRSAGPTPITRDDVGDRMRADPVLEGRFTVELLDGTRVEGRAPVRALPAAPAGLRPRYRGRDHARPEGPHRAPGRGHLDALAGRDPRGRGHQPLVPRHRGQPRHAPAAHAHRQHRQAGRRVLFVGRELQVRALPGGRVERAGDQRLVLRGPLQPEPGSERLAQGHPLREVREGRGAGLLEPRGPTTRGRHAEVRAEGLHGHHAHADPDEGPLVHQREPAEQREARLRHALQRQPEDRHDRLAGHRDDLLLRVRGRDPRGELVAGVRGARGHRLLLEPVPAGVEGWDPAGVRHEGRHGDPRRGGLGPHRPHR